jgi:hypothetical protein
LLPTVVVVVNVGSVGIDLATAAKERKLQRTESPSPAPGYPAALPIGSGLTLIHLIGIPVTSLLVNPGAQARRF